MTRVLVLVLSCLREPYASLRMVQERTWGQVLVPGVEVVYYDCQDLALAPRNLRQALAATLGREWDHVFRTNLSSYVDPERLLLKAETLPKEKCYQGIDGGGFASGSGFFLSRDLCEVLVRDLPDRVPDGVVEDELVGRLLAPRGVGVLPGAERYDYHFRRHLLRFRGLSEDADDAEIRTAYHVRCKGAGVDRQEDIFALEAVHRLKYET